MNEDLIPLSVLIPVYNEEKNLDACLSPLKGWADEILIVDSNSTDKTYDIARSYGAKIIQFDYKGGWPKKRQWALDSYDFKNDWVLLLDADEILLPKIKTEICEAIKKTKFEGYYINFQMEFLGKMLKWSYPGLKKLCLIKKGKGHFEMLYEKQDESMSPIEINEHMIINGKKGYTKAPVLHKNGNSISRYILKHNEYSNWEANVLMKGSHNEMKPRLFGNQAQRRRWIKKNFSKFFFAPILYFIYMYIFKLGILDGKPGLYYLLFRVIQMYHVRAKIYELKVSNLDKNDI